MQGHGARHEPESRQEKIQNRKCATCFGASAVHQEVCKYTLCQAIGWGKERLVYTKRPLRDYPLSGLGFSLHNIMTSKSVPIVGHNKSGRSCLRVEDVNVEQDHSQGNL